MSVEEALKEADKLYSTRRATCSAVLAAEVRRLRAAVEAVRALHSIYINITVQADSLPLPILDRRVLDRDDVLRILEGK